MQTLGGRWGFKNSRIPHFSRLSWLLGTAKWAKVELRDLIDQDTWETIIQLPDDVTIQTTNVYGRKIRLAEAIRADWVSITLDVYGAVEENGSSPFNETVTNSFSELQASLFSAISGYYRTGISTLRNVLEHLTIGLDYELKHSRTQFDDWMNGDENKNIKFGISASCIASKSNKQVSDLEIRLIATVGDNIFRQEDKSKGDAVGFSRRHFADLSKYTHAVRPYQAYLSVVTPSSQGLDLAGLFTHREG